MSETKTPFDPLPAHHWFAAECFNTTWELIEKPDRTDADIEEMIHRAHASRYHWGHAKDCTPHNLAVGTWQLSRVYALAGLLDEAERYARQYLTLCNQHNFGPFDLAFAHEAFARIEGLRGNTTARDSHLAKAREAAEAGLMDAEDRQWLEANLDPLIHGEHGWPHKKNA